jgi:signal transduction histidine kinase
VSRLQQNKLAAFAAAVAHDVNEELTVLLNAVSRLLRRVPADDPVRPALEELEGAVLRCVGITDGLLEWTRRKGGDGRVPLDHFLVSD